MTLRSFQQEKREGGKLQHKNDDLSNRSTHMKSAEMKATDLTATKEPAVALPLSSSSDHCSTTSVSEELFPFWQEMAVSLGEGPMRFAPKHLGDRESTEPAESCSTTTASETHDSSSASSSSSPSSQSSRERQCCQNLKRQWEASNSEVPISYELYLRTVESREGPSPEYTPFGLSIEELEPQLLTEVGSDIATGVIPGIKNHLPMISFIADSHISRHS